MKVVAIAVAGAGGAITRYWIGVAFGGAAFPWSTLGINLAGSFLLGLLLGGAAASRWNETFVAAVGIGFLGAFTTFSTFSYETVGLLRAGRAPAAAAYVALSVLLGVAAAGAGYAIARATS